jgi:predicted enzyme related to lactoylglutathione lyase
MRLDALVIMRRGRSRATVFGRDPVAARNAPRVALTWRSVDDTLERVSAQGGAPVEAPSPKGDLRVAIFRDPAGNVIGVWQRGSHG